MVYHASRNSNARRACMHNAAHCCCCSFRISNQLLPLCFLRLVKSVVPCPDPMTPTRAPARSGTRNMPACTISKTHARSGTRASVVSSVATLRRARIPQLLKPPDIFGKGVVSKFLSRKLASHSSPQDQHTGFRKKRTSGVRRSSAKLSHSYNTLLFIVWKCVGS